MLTDTPVRLRYWRIEFLRPLIKESKTTAISLRKQWYPEIKADTSPKFKRQDEVYFTPASKRMNEVEPGFDNEGTCNICLSTVPEKERENGCPICRLSRLYNTDSNGQVNGYQSEDDIYKAFYEGTTKDVLSLSDKELESFLQKIIAVQQIQEIARKKGRILQGIVEKEMIKRKPKTKVSAAEGKATERKAKAKADPMAELAALGINIADLLKQKES